MKVFDKKNPMNGEYLKSLDESQLIRTVREIGSQNQKEYSSILVDLIPGSDGGVRETLVRTLSYLADDNAITKLIDFLGDEDSSVNRNSAIEILENLGEKALPSLMPKLKDPDPDIRKFVVDILGNIRSPQVVDQIVELLHDEDINVRSAVAESLGKIACKKSINALINCLYDHDWVKVYAIEALAQVGGREVLNHLLPLLEDKSPMIALAVIKTIGKIGDETILSHLISFMGKNPAIDSYTAQAIGEISGRMEEQGNPPDYTLMEGILPVLRENLEEDDDEIIEESVSLLGRFQTPGALEILVEYMAQHQEVPDFFKEAVAKYPSSMTEVIPGKIRADRDYNIDFFIQLLSDSDSSASREFILNCLDCPDDNIRLSAVNCLYKTTPQESIPSLIKLLKDPIGHIRRSSARNLGRLKCREALPDLFELMKDQYEDVRFGAGEAICEIAQEEELIQLSRLLFDKDENLRISSAHALSRMASFPQVVEDNILKALSDKNWRVRKYSVTACKAIPKDKVLDSILLSLNDENNEVKMKAIGVLCGYKDENLLTYLYPLLEDEDVWVRYEAVREISGFKKDEVTDLLINRLEDPSEVVIIAAINSLGRMGGEKAFHAVSSMTDHPDMEVSDTAYSVIEEMETGFSSSPVNPADAITLGEVGDCIEHYRK